MRTENRILWRITVVVTSYCHKCAALLEREWAQDSQRTTKERMFVRVRWARWWRDARQAEAAPCGEEVTPRTSPWCVEASEGGPAAGTW